MSGKLFLIAIVLVAVVAAASSLSAQQRGANPNLLRFCPGSGIPCVEITREAYDPRPRSVPVVVRLLPWADGSGRQRRAKPDLFLGDPA
jgi:hypothetical protein